MEWGCELMKSLIMANVLSASGCFESGSDCQNPCSQINTQNLERDIRRQQIEMDHRWSI
jgi:hypothetical protein